MKKPLTVDYRPTHSFYRPHERVQYTGELVNSATGEVYKPVPRVKQSFKDECDINNILAQYRQTGMIRHVQANAALGVYADLPDALDFQESMNLVLAAEQSFMSLPAKVRDRFQNNPAEFLAFMSDPGNVDEMIKLGLAVKRPQAQAGGEASEPATGEASPPAGGGTGGSSPRA